MIDKNHRFTPSQIQDALNFIYETIVIGNMLGLENEIRVAIAESDCFAAVEDLTTDPNQVLNKELYESGLQVLQVFNQIIEAEVQIEDEVDSIQHFRI